MSLPGRKDSRESGYALIAATVFAFVLLLAGASFFTLVSYETKGALYRQSSSESFLLADGAVERSRAKFLEDRSWRDGWAAEPEGDGEYDLTATDTTYLGEPAVRLLATGRVRNGERKVEVMADIPPTGFGLTMLIMDDADAGGNLCLDGEAHVNGDADFGPSDVHLTCGGTYTDGFVITPPPIYTDPAHFPGATYYYVEGVSTPPVRAHIFDESGADITAAKLDSLVGIVSWNNGQNLFTFEFKNTDLQKYFNDSTGIFNRTAGDDAVVVNFGEVFSNPAVVRSNVILDDNSSIWTTVIDTRFIGVTETDRLDWNYWYGGQTHVKKVVMEPRTGIALITNDFEKSGGSLVQIGTEAWPALVYVTHDVVSLNSNFNLIGSIIVLRDWNSTGGPNLTYNGGFINNLPDYLVDDWPSGVSGTLKILRWREVAAS